MWKDHSYKLAKFSFREVVKMARDRNIPEDHGRNIFFEIPLEKKVQYIHITKQDTKNLLPFFYIFFGLCLDLNHKLP